MINLDKTLLQLYLRFKLVSYVRWCQTNLNRLISDKNVSWNCQRITIYDTLYLDHRYDIFCLQATYWSYFFCSVVEFQTIWYISLYSKILMDVVQAQHYQKVLPYEAVQHLANALKVIIKEAMNRVRREEIGKDLPISDCLQLVENNASLVCNFSTSIKTSNKVKCKQN